nr:putative cell wall binding repeat 2 [uncultured bacterium]
MVGGEKAVSSDEESSLKQCVDGVERIQGATRIDTALQIYEAGKSLSAGWGETAVVVTGGNNQNGFADALSVTSYAYAQKAPVFLSDAETGLTADQQNALKDGNFTQIVIVGGAQAVPEFVSAQIEQTVGIKPIRIAGQTRYNTSILFARWAIGQGALTMNNVVFTTGQNYPRCLIWRSFGWS